MTTASFSKDVLKIDPAEVTRRIEAVLREQVFHQLKRKGAVVGLSGGIDSSVTAALCARALGNDRVLGLLMPELDSSDESLQLARLLAEKIRIETLIENIDPMLEAVECYQKRDDAIREQVPEFGLGWKCKLALAGTVERGGVNFFHLVVESDRGEQRKVRLNSNTYLGIVAATNMKQRARKFFEYYHADRLYFVVAGTPNRLEHDQGFFVKNGDGASDIKPIAHLYKSQVYQLAAYLNVPEEIQKRQPTTDTYSLAQSQQEFYFALPYEEMDLCLFARNHSVSASEVGAALGLAVEHVERIYADIDRKRMATRYLSSPPLLVETI
jgi:NAD+ synthase